MLRPVFDATHGADGFVSIEVSPYLATNTKGTIEEAKRLWREVNRKNLLIKVPATSEGLPAIHDLTADGINVNITLLFAQQVYEQVVEAYLSGLEAFAAKGGEISRIASVASFFVSRIDTEVDKLLDEKIARANDPDEKARLAALKGKIAVANAKLAYQRYLRLFAGERWHALEANGAKPQRLLWASTGTKNKAYSDVLYVEELIGPDTINTMPLATIEAFRDHGKLRDTLQADVAEAQRLLGELDRAGVSLQAVTDKLIRDGVRLFADAADKLLAAVAKKRIEILGDAVDRQSFALDQQFKKRVDEIADEWRAHGNVRRLWQRDKSLWTNSDEDRWLGWLDSIDDARIAQYVSFAGEIKQENFKDAVLLGMGGSSLGPQVLAETFGQQNGWPRLRILDSTVPAQIKEVEAELDLSRTLFIVSSKSGGTTEPNIFSGLFLRQGCRQSRSEPGRQTIHRDYRSRFGAGTARQGAALPPDLSRRADDRWTLFGPLPVRSGAGRHRRLEHCGTREAIAEHDPLVRTRRAARRKSGGYARHYARRCGGARPRQDHDAGFARAGELRRLGRAIVRGIHRQTGQRLDPDRWRTARQTGSLWRRSALYRPCAQRRKRCRARGQTEETRNRGPSRHSHRAEFAAVYRPGIRSLRNRNRGRGIRPWHQSVRSARCGSE